MRTTEDYVRIISEDGSVRIHNKHKQTLASKVEEVSLVLIGLQVGHSIYELSATTTLIELELDEHNNIMKWTDQ